MLRFGLDDSYTVAEDTVVKVVLEIADSHDDNFDSPLDLNTSLFVYGRITAIPNINIQSTQNTYGIDGLATVEISLSNVDGGLTDLRPVGQAARITVVDTSLTNNSKQEVIGQVSKFVVGLTCSLSLQSVEIEALRTELPKRKILAKEFPQSTQVGTAIPLYWGRNYKAHCLFARKNSYLREWDFIIGETEIESVQDVYRNEWALDRISAEVEAGVYILREGDNLASLATRFNVTERSLKESILVTDSSFSLAAGLVSFDYKGLTVYNNNFYLVDSLNNTIQAYSITGDAGTSYNLASANRNPEGIAVGNNSFWVVDAVDAQIYSYAVSNGSEGTSINLVSANSDPFGIAFFNNRLWVVDKADNKVYVYNASTGARDTTSEFNLDTRNGRAEGIAIHDNKWWVIGQEERFIFAYDLSGTYLPGESFRLGTENHSATGIVFYNGLFYVLDRSQKRFYRYEGEHLEKTFDLRATTPIASTHAGETYYVLNSEDHSVYAYEKDGSTPDSNAVFEVHANPRGIAATTNRILVGERRHAEIGNYFLHSYTLSGSIQATEEVVLPIDNLPDSPHDQFTIDDVSLWYLSVADNTLYRIAYPIMPRIRNNEHGQSVAGAMFNNNKFYFIDAAFDNDKVIVYNSNRTRDFDSDFNVGRDGSNRTVNAIGLAFDDTLIWTCHTRSGASPKLVSYNLSGTKQSTEYTLEQDNPFALAFHDDHFFVADATDHKVYAYKSDGTKVDNNLPDGQRDFAVNREGNIGSPTTKSSSNLLWTQLGSSFPVFDARWSPNFANELYLIRVDISTNIGLSLYFSPEQMTTDNYAKLRDEIAENAMATFSFVDSGNTRSITLPLTVASSSPFLVRHLTSFSSLSSALQTDLRNFVSLYNQRSSSTNIDMTLRIATTMEGRYADVLTNMWDLDFSQSSPGSMASIINSVGERYLYVVQDARRDNVQGVTRVYVYRTITEVRVGRSAADGNLNLRFPDDHIACLAFKDLKVWIVFTDNRVGVYNLNISRSADDDWTLSGANADPKGIDHGVINAGEVNEEDRWWVVDGTDLKIYSYTIAGVRDNSLKDIDLHSDNANPQDMTYHAGHLYVIDDTALKVFAYNASTKAHVPNRDFVLWWNNRVPAGIAFQDTKFYVTDFSTTYVETDVTLQADADKNDMFEYPVKDDYSNFDIADTHTSGDMTVYNDHFYFVDTDRSEVFATTIDGTANPSLTFSTNSNNDTPEAIAHGASEFWIADRDTHIVNRYSNSGSYQSTYSSFTLSDVSEARGLAVLTTQLYIVRGGADADVVLYNKDGTRPATNNRWDLVDENSSPRGLSILDNELFYVADHETDSCFVYFSDGGSTPVHSETSLIIDTEEDAFTPRGITYYNGLFYVLDQQNEMMRVYEPDGNYLENQNFSIQGGMRYFTYYNNRFWGININADQVRAYDVQTQSLTGIFTLGYADDPRPTGIAYFNARFYIVDRTEDAQHCYVFEANLSGTLIDEEGFALDPLNTQPNGIEYYNNRLYIPDSSERKIFVYTVDGKRRPNEDIPLDENNVNPGDITYHNRQLWLIDTGVGNQRTFTYATLTTGNPLIVPLTDTSQEFDGFQLSESDRRPNNWYELWYIDIFRGNATIGSTFIRGFQTNADGVPLEDGDGYNSLLNIALFNEPQELQLRDIYDLREYRLLSTTPDNLLDTHDNIVIEIPDIRPEEQQRITIDLPDTSDSSAGVINWSYSPDRPSNVPLPAKWAQPTTRTLELRSLTINLPDLTSDGIGTDFLKWDYNDLGSLTSETFDGFDWFDIDIEMVLHQFTLYSDGAIGITFATDCAGTVRAIPNLAFSESVQNEMRVTLSATGVTTVVIDELLLDSFDDDGNSIYFPENPEEVIAFYNAIRDDEDARDSMTVNLQPNYNGERTVEVPVPFFYLIRIGIRSDDEVVLHLGYSPTASVGVSGHDFTTEIEDNIRLTLSAPGVTPLVLDGIEDPDDMEFYVWTPSVSPNRVRNFLSAVRSAGEVNNTTLTLDINPVFFAKASLISFLNETYLMRDGVVSLLDLNSRRHKWTRILSEQVQAISIFEEFAYGIKLVRGTLTMYRINDLFDSDETTAISMRDINVTIADTLGTTAEVVSFFEVEVFDGTNTLCVLIKLDSGNNYKLYKTVFPTDGTDPSLVELTRHDDTVEVIPYPQSGGSNAEIWEATSLHGNRLLFMIKEQDINGVNYLNFVEYDFEKEEIVDLERGIRQALISDETIKSNTVTEFDGLLLNYNYDNQVFNVIDLDGSQYSMLRFKKFQDESDIDNMYASIVGKQDTADTDFPIPTPPFVLHDILTNTRYGLGLSVNDTSFNDAKAIFNVLRFFAEGGIISERDVQHVIEQLLSMRDMRLLKTGTGLLELKTLRIFNANDPTIKALVKYES